MRFWRTITGRAGLVLSRDLRFVLLGLAIARGWVGLTAWNDRQKNKGKNGAGFCGLPPLPQERQGWGTRLQSKEVCWFEDCGAAEWVKREKVLVAGDNEVCAAIYGEGQEFIVFGVAAGLDGGMNCDDLAALRVLSAESFPTSRLVARSNRGS